MLSSEDWGIRWKKSDHASEDLHVPVEFENVITGFDRQTAVVDEHKVRDSLRILLRALGNRTEAEQLGIWAEVLAFELVPNKGSPSPWKTYFGPSARGNRADGGVLYSPDIIDTPAVVLEHWGRRARMLRHAVLRARYADLVWDMGVAFGQGKRDVEFARTAIDAYVESLQSGLRPDLHLRFEAVMRALDLATTIHDVARTDAVRAALLQLHREAVIASKGPWWIAPDRLFRDKRTRLTDLERDQLIADLEGVVARHSNVGNSATFNPHATKSAAKRLIEHYSTRGLVEESRRLHELIGRTFEQVASQAGSMVSADFLQTAINAYDRAGLVKESRRLRVLMEETIAASCDEAGEITFETSIPKEDMETFLGQIVVPDLASTFARIAIGFLPSRNRLEECVSKLQEQTPLMAVIGQSIIGDRQVSAKVGSTEDDPFGRLVRRAYNEMWLSEIWLIAALRRTLETHEAIPAHFVTWAARSRVFDDLTLLHEGVAAWIEADFVKAIHVLIPQVEKGLRGIASELGRPVTRAHPAAMGTSVTVGMGELLYSTDMQKVLGPDLTLYFLTLYADPRGFNLRNAVAHGLLSVDGMHEGVATRLIQTLLVLGAWKALVRARSNVSNRAAPDSGGDTLHDS